MPKTLTHTTHIVIRFSECDPLQMVWHGNYIKYLEDGREDFGAKYNLGYKQIYEATGLAVPLVHIECDYKKMASYGDTLRIETTLIDTPAAKIIFEYKVFNGQNELVCIGKSIQVFVSAVKKELSITVPPFYEEWKKKYLS